MPDRRSEPLPAPGEHELEWPPRETPGVTARRWSIDALALLGVGVATVASLGALWSMGQRLDRLEQPVPTSQVDPVSSAAEDTGLGYTMVNFTEGGHRIEAQRRAVVWERMMAERSALSQLGAWRPRPRPTVERGRATIQFGPPRGSGDLQTLESLDETDIARAISLLGSQLTLCYRDAARAQDAPAGEATLRFVIGVDGAVRDASVSDADFDDPALAACFVARAEASAFRSLRSSELARVYLPVELRLDQ